MKALIGLITTLILAISAIGQTQPTGPPLTKEQKRQIKMDKRAEEDARRYDAKAAKRERLGGQTSGSRSSENPSDNSKTGDSIIPEVARAQDAVNSVLAESGKAFRDGLVAYADDRRSDAGLRFNQSLEVFLYSTLNIQKEQRLQTCYNQLIETIYRIEFPSEKREPQIQLLAKTCSWNVDPLLTDDAAKRAHPVTDFPAKITDNGTRPAIHSTAGFVSQQFESSLFDELSRLETATVERSNVPSVRIVKAKAGDTVEKIAIRERVSVTELAKYNGLLTNSVLFAGREIKIPGQYIGYKQPAPISTCNLTVERAPVLRGIRLRMTPSEVSKIAGRILPTKDYETSVLEGNRKLHANVGEKRTVYSGPSIRRNASFDGIRTVGMNFYDNKLFRIMVGYDKEGYEWKNAGEFALIVSEKLSLPKNGWTNTTDSASLDCGGFKVSATIVAGGDAYLIVSDVLTSILMEYEVKINTIETERKKKELEMEKKRTFKP